MWGCTSAAVVVISLPLVWCAKRLLLGRGSMLEKLRVESMILILCAQFSSLRGETSLNFGPNCPIVAQLYPLLGWLEISVQVIICPNIFKFHMTFPAHKCGPKKKPWSKSSQVNGAKWKMNFWAVRAWTDFFCCAISNGFLCEQAITFYINWRTTCQISS